MRKGNKNAPTGQENHVKISANTSPKTTIIHSVPTEWTLQQILPCLVNILCRLNFILPLNSLLWPHPTRKKGSLIWKAHTNNVSSFLHWGHVFTSFIIGVWILRSISFKLFNDEQIFFLKWKLLVDVSRESSTLVSITKYHQISWYSCPTLVTYNWACRLHFLYINIFFPVFRL